MESTNATMSCLFWRAEDGRRSPVLASLLDGETALDERAVARALCGVARGSESLFVGVQREPEAWPRDEATCPDPARTLRSRLAAATCDLAGPIDVALSGGLDSAVLTVLATQAGPVRTWTLDDGFDEETQAAAGLAAHLGVPNERVGVRPEDLPDHFEQAVRTSGGVLWNARAVAKLAFLKALAREGVSRLVVGLGADELLADPAPEMEAIAARRQPERDLGFSLLRDGHRREIPAAAEWLEGGPGDPRRRLLATIWPTETRPPECGAALATGIQLVCPFLSWGVASFALGLAPGLRRRGAWNKWLLRSAFEGVVPPGVCWRPKTPRIAPAGGKTSRGRDRWLARLDEALSAARLARLGAVDVAAARRLFDAHAKNADGPARDAALMRLGSISLLAGLRP